MQYMPSEIIKDKKKKRNQNNTYKWNQDGGNKCVYKYDYSTCIRCINELTRGV